MFVKLWMKTNPVVIGQERPLAEADALMREHTVRRLPVVDNENNLVGMITRVDIAKALPIDGAETAATAQTPVAAFMSPGPITTDPMEPLEDATNTMRKNGIGGMPVVDRNGSLLGIITESDVCRAMMDILGAEEAGARIEIQVGKTAKDFYETFEIFKDFNMTVRSVAVYPDFSENQQLLTIRVQGEGIEDMIDSLWKSGCKIHRIMVNDR